MTSCSTVMWRDIAIERRIATDPCLRPCRIRDTHDVLQPTSFAKAETLRLEKIPGLPGPFRRRKCSGILFSTRTV